MKDYARIFNDKVVEIKRNAVIKPAGVDWKQLILNQPAFDKSIEYLVVDNYEIFADKVIENYKIEPINFEPMPIEDEHELEV